MTRPIDFQRLADDWLADGPTVIPDRVLQAALDEVHLTHQRRFGAARRTFSMNTNFLRLAAAIVAIVVLLWVGLAALGRLPSGLVGGQPSPSPTPRALSASFREMPAGSYVTTEPFKMPGIVFTVGDRWQQSEMKPAKNQIELVRAGEAYNEALIAFEVPTAVYADPCQTGTARFDPPTGPTVEDFIADLRRMRHFTVGPTSSITIDGVTGTEFDFTYDTPPAGGACDSPLPPPAIPVWDTADAFVGVRQHIVLLPVRDQRLLIDAWYTAPTGTSERDVRAVISSIELP